MRVAVVLSLKMDALWDRIRVWDADLPHIVAANGLAFAQPTRASLDGLIDAAFGHYDENCVFVDLGSGTGTVLFHMAVRGHIERCIGVEIDEALVGISQERLQQLSPSVPVDVFHRDILSLTADDMQMWSNNGKLRLLVYSFDARFPRHVTDHIANLITREYRLGPITWLTCASAYRLGVPEVRELPVHLVLDSPGKGEVMLVRGDQEENYPPEEWEELSEAEGMRQLALIRNFGRRKVEPHQMEYMVVYSYNWEPQAKHVRINTAIYVL
jgi:SAM-dependent methyltransferase